MAKQNADAKSIADYFDKKVKKIASIPLDDIILIGKGVELVFEKKLNTTQQKKIKDDVINILRENFYGSYKIDNVKVGRFDSTLLLEIEQSGSMGPVPTDIQEEGSAFILTQVLKKNKKFTSANDILNDVETNNGLKKIFGRYGPNTSDWVHSYYEHQSAFFKKFQPSQWTIFEHGGQDLMTFIKKQCDLVKEVTPSGKLKDVGKYTTWNPTDIWAVNNKSMVTKKINDAIQKDGQQTLTELNNVLLNLMKDNMLIGLSLKKIDDKEKAKFMYVNKDPKSIEFAEVEQVKSSDVKIEIKTEENKDGMNQGGYVKFGQYTINIIRTPTEGFSNLKFESSIIGSGARGGAAPVGLVESLLNKRVPRGTFVNKHQEYPKTADEFKNDKRNYEAMYKSLSSQIVGTNNYKEFEDRILKMYESNKSKSMYVAQSKLMQLHFFSDAMTKTKGKPEELWTDLLYLSLKVGKRFAPHGKLS